MKTGKKILALLLVFCFMMAAVPAYAASFAHYIPTRVDNELWGRWEAGEKDAVIKNVRVSVQPGSGGVTLMFNDADIQKLRNSGELMNGYSITLPDMTFGTGENIVTVPGGKFAIKTTSGLWVTHYLPTNGPVAQAMVEESKTDEALRALLNIDPETDAANLETENNVYNGNINAYIKYKTGLKELSAVTDNAILHAANSINANGDFLAGTFFLDDESIATFVGGETPVVGDYGLDHGVLGLYKSNHIGSDSNLDGPYTVFTAPATGFYDVFVFKRDANSSSVSGSAYQRHIEVDIAGVTMNFGNSNTTGTMTHHWQNEDAHTPIYLTKGQQVPVRILSGTGYYVSAHAFAFVPRSDAETPVSVSWNASPTSQDTFSKYSIKVNVPAAETKTITIDGKEVAVTAGAAESYYPNLRKSDANGNYINQPTLLDALVAADKQADIGIDGHVLTTDITQKGTSMTKNGYLNTYATDTMAFSPTTAPIFGYDNLPGGAGDLYASIFSGAETFFLASGTEVKIPVKVPEDGTYYMIANGGSWETKRTIHVELDADTTKTYARADGVQNFYFGGVGENAHYNVQSANGIELTAGYHTMKVKVSGGAVRLSYVALVKADSQDAAKAIQDSFGKGEKDKFNAYFNVNARTVFDGSAIPGLNVVVNGKKITEDYDRYILSENDVVLINPMDPIEVKGYEAFDSNLDYDNNRQLTAETRANSNYIIIISKTNIKKLNLPVDPTVKDSMRGLYLNGYITYKADDEATSGDDTKVANYIHYPIQGNSIDTKGRLIIAFKVKEINNNTTFDGLQFRNIAGSFNGGIYSNFNCTNFFITDGRFDGTDDSIRTVQKGDKLSISTKKAQPIMVTVKNADGTKVSTNYALNINAPVEIDVEAGQTVYIWEGTPYLASGTTAKPLCAPITVE